MDWMFPKTAARRLTALLSVAGAVCAVLGLMAGCGDEEPEVKPPWLVEGASLGLRDVDLRDFVPGCPSDDCFRILDGVATVSTSEVSYLEEDDWVVAVEYENEGGEASARAYPLGLLWWHHGIQDDLAGDEIFVSYSALTGSALVYEAEHDGRSRSFGFSERYYNSCAVFYYTETDSSDQVWLPQLYTASVTGPNAPLTWNLWPSRELTWSRWRELFPEGEVATFPTGTGFDYTSDPFEEYRNDPDWILLPLSEPPDNRFAWKERTLLVRVGRSYRAYPLSELAGSGASVTQTLGGVEFTVGADEDGVFTVDGPDGVQSFAVYWFACAAFHPGIEVYTRP